MNYRTISASFPAVLRFILVLLIIAAFGMAIAGVDKSGGAVKGVKDDKQIVSMEIEKTLKVVEMQPDYAAAWTRLSVLYEQMGDSENAKLARDNADRLNVDL